MKSQQCDLVLFLSIPVGDDFEFIIWRYRYDLESGYYCHDSQSKRKAAGNADFPNGLTETFSLVG